MLNTKGAKKNRGDRSHHSRRGECAARPVGRCRTPARNLIRPGQKDPEAQEVNGRDGWPQSEEGTGNDSKQREKSQQENPAKEAYGTKKPGGDRKQQNRGGGVKKGSVLPGGCHRGEGFATYRLGVLANLEESLQKRKKTPLRGKSEKEKGGVQKHEVGFRRERGRRKKG